MINENTSSKEQMIIVNGLNDMTDENLSSTQQIVLLKKQLLQWCAKKLQIYQPVN